MSSVSVLEVSDEQSELEDGIDDNNVSTWSDTSRSGNIKYPTDHVFFIIINLHSFFSCST